MLLPPQLPDKNCNFKQKMSFCVPLPRALPPPHQHPLCVSGNSGTAPLEEGTLFFYALENCKWETLWYSTHDPKVGSCEVLLPEQGPAQEKGQPDSESLHKIHSFQLLVPLSFRQLEASDTVMILLIPAIPLSAAEGDLSNTGTGDFFPYRQLVGQSTAFLDRLLKAEFPRIP